MFHRVSDPPFTDKEESDFERIIAAVGHDGHFHYDSAFPKYRFIDYIVQRRNLVVHGSNHMDIREFETRRQTLFNGDYADAVFASRDGRWSIFYAILDRSKVVYHFRNGCFKASDSKRYYFFSLTQATHDNGPWTDGVIYFLPAEPFVRSTRGRTYFDEWTCSRPVGPVYKLSVGPADFGMFDRVAVHKPNESIVTTWLKYKLRTTGRARIETRT